VLPSKKKCDRVDRNWHIHMKTEEIKDLIEKVEAFGTNRRSILDSLDIPESTYYSWRDMYKKGGIAGLKKKHPPVVGTG